MLIEKFPIINIFSGVDVSFGTITFFFKFLLELLHNRFHGAFR